MPTQRTFWLFVLALGLANPGCAGRDKNAPKPGTLAAAIQGCQQAQHHHYLTAGTNPTLEEDENQIVPYRVYEGVPNFVMRECMEAQWPESYLEDVDDAHWLTPTESARNK